MGWKRIKKEFQKTGKSIENEGKRVAERIDNELNRFLERRIDSTTASEYLESSDKSQSAEVIPIVQQSVPVLIAPPVEDISTEEINANPENLKPGRAYLINHLTFNDPALIQRTGSENDLKRLRQIFEKFGMEVKQVDDGTVADVKDVMDEISSFDFLDLSCLVIVIMSHGFEQNIIAAKDGKYSLDYNIMYPILRNKSLASKLKLIITEGCKGVVDPMFEIEGPQEKQTEITSEILQVYSCVEGYVSYLSKSGSIFITTLCEHLEQSGLKKNILDIANAVILAVKENYL